MSNMKETRILLLGKTGVGKSKTGNTILGIPNVFYVHPNPDPGTLKCQSERNHRFERNVLVVDTTGVYHADETLDKIEDDIKDSMIMVSPGPHAIVLCVQMGRFDRIDIDTLHYYLNHFGGEIMKYVVLVFTHYDNWIENMTEAGETDIKIDLFTSKLPKEYQKFLSEIDNRFVTFNNQLKGEEADKQVKELLEIVDKLIATNNGNFYTNDKFRAIEEILKSSDDLSSESVTTVRSQIPWKTIGTAALVGIGAMTAILKHVK